MGKIKGWKIDRKGVSWETDNRMKEGYDSRGNLYPKKAIYVFSSPNGWVVRDTSTFKNPEISPSFKTKLEAKNWAIDFMKSHPNG